VYSCLLLPPINEKSRKKITRVLSHYQGESLINEKEKLEILSVNLERAAILLDFKHDIICLYEL
jgi:hypothetical protein